MINEECLDCSGDSELLSEAVTESLELMSKFSPDASSIKVDDVMNNNIIEIRDRKGQFVTSVPEILLQHTVDNYERCGIKTRGWTYTRVFRAATIYAENLEDQREKVRQYEQDRDSNFKPTPQQSGVSEESNSFPEEGLFRLDFNENLLRQHSELCAQLRQDSYEGDFED